MLGLIIHQKNCLAAFLIILIFTVCRSALNLEIKYLATLYYSYKHFTYLMHNVNSLICTGK